MKITNTTQKPSFEPITVSIVIENQEEYDAIMKISKRNESIPNLFSAKEQPVIVSFLKGLGEALYNNNTYK